MLEASPNTTARHTCRGDRNGVMAPPHPSDNCIALHIYSDLATCWSTRRRANRSESATANASHPAMGTAVAGMNPRYTCSKVTCSGIGRSAGTSRCGAAQPKAASAARSRAETGWRRSAGIRMPEARVRMRASKRGHGCAGSSGTPSCSGSTVAAPVASASSGVRMSRSKSAGSWLSDTNEFQTHLHSLAKIAVAGTVA